MSQVNIKNTLDIVEKINEYIARKEKDLPYNINVIDELHANENAHSRILCKLLQYKDSSNKFRILEDLIQYISQIKAIIHMQEMRYIQRLQMLKMRKIKLKIQSLMFIRIMYT